MAMKKQQQQQQELNMKYWKHQFAMQCITTNNNNNNKQDSVAKERKQAKTMACAMGYLKNGQFLKLMMKMNDAI